MKKTITILLVVITLGLKAQTINKDSLNTYNAVEIVDTSIIYKGEIISFEDYNYPEWEHVRIDRETKDYMKKHPKEPYLTVWYSGNLVCALYSDLRMVVYNQKTFMHSLLLLAILKN